MRTLKDVEAYLSRLNRRFEAVEGHDGTFLVHGPGNQPPIALRVEPPLLVFRIHVGDAPKTPADHQARFYRRLLELNAKALVHTCFALEGERIVLSSALELENLDFNEMEATLDEIDLAIAQHVPALAELSKS